MHTQPVEDIDAVLGRFQAWTGARNSVETKPGIRELSYEEALSRHRRRPPARKPGPQLGPEPVVVPGVAPIAVPASASADPELERPKQTASKVRESKQRSTRRTAAQKHVAKAPAQRSAVKHATRPAFCEVLAEAVRPAEVIVAAAQPLELSRQVAISIRLAPAEGALIKTRAAEMGISASAYLRQCALEVEQLRAQVQQTLAAMECKGAGSTQFPVRTPGFFARLVRRFFPANGQALALRA